MLGLAEPGAPSTLEMISFEIAGQAFCIDIRNVREIRGWTAVTPVPGSAEGVLGVINLRGFVMGVVDLRHMLGFGRTEPSSRHVIVVVQDETRVAGILVDAVQEAFQVDAGLLQSPPYNSEGGNFVDALIPLDGKLMSRLVMRSLLPGEIRPAA